MRKFVFILIFCFLGIASNTVIGVTEKDSLALVALYDSTDGANWTNTWDLNTPVDTWYGVTVTNNNVTKINFSQNNLSGNIPSQIGDLDSLEYLRLYYNPNLTGEVPPEIGNLENLRYIYIDQNGLTGAIPVEITNCLKLEILRVSNNELNSIPDLSVLPLLRDLSIAGNNFSGPLPEFFYSLTNMVSLNVTLNQFEGEISPDIANLQELQWFYFYNNNFSGTIPKEIGTLKKVTFLSINNNNFSGEIPPELGDMDNLLYFRLGGNQLTGEIPEHLANLDNLRELNLSNNQLTGSIPDSIGYITSLTTIYLTNNNLEGNLPKTFKNLVNLEDVQLTNNNFTGGLDSVFDNANNLKTMYLDGNSFEGALPDSFTTFPNLTHLFLGSTNRGNNFNALPSFAENENVLFLDVRNNNLTFEDIEPQLAKTNFGYFRYSPQDSVGKDTTIMRQIGESFTTSINIGGSANKYQWFLDGVEIDGATENSLTIDQISAEDYGDYICEITSDSVSDLTLYSFPVTLTDQITSINDNKNNMPRKFVLRQNYPNPFNPLTHIRFGLPNSSDVKIEVFDILGHKVVTLLDTEKPAGYHTIDFDASNFASGVYLYRIHAEGFVDVKKMVLIR